jgi:sugar phosphate isomerase/epimerase
MWLDGMSYLGIYNGMKRAITTAAGAGVPNVVVHISHGWYPPEVNDIGLKRFDELVMLAGELGVNIAMENVYSIGNLAYLSDRYDKLPHVGLCYDAGHEHCFTKTVSWLDVFAGRTFCTHLNDNPGRPGGKEGNTDMHWLPFEGDVDYADMMRKLNRDGYEGSLILEINDRPYGKYKDMTHEEYLKMCYNIVKRISELG